MNNNLFFKKTGFLLWFLFLALVSFAQNSDPPVRTGLDRLLLEQIDLIKDKSIAIVGNPTSVDAQGHSIVSLLKPHTRVVALFGPEHGFQGAQSAGDLIENAWLEGIPLYSLYGSYRMPSAAMLKGCEAIVFDMQDVGVRFYTYISTLFYVLCAAEREGIPVIVLDRPNPITASRVEGPVLNPARSSFVGVMPIPIRYGMTVGELARLMNEETYAGFTIGANLTVIPMTGYRRTMEYDETGLPWIAPSPNMPDLETALVYPGMCLFEGTNLSEGRGADAPFLTVGAPFIVAEQWIRNIPHEACRGVSLQPITYTPRSIPGKADKPKYQGQVCHGIRLKVTNRQEFRPIDFAVAILCTARSLYPNDVKITHFMDSLWGDESLRAGLESGTSQAEILKYVSRKVQNFLPVRKKYQLYPEES